MFKSNVCKIIQTSLAGVTLLTGFVASGTPTAAAPTRELAMAQTQRVRVFLPRYPGQNNNMGYVEPVWRQTQNSAVATFALEQLIAGPTVQERRQGFTQAIQLRGASNCGKDFTFSITSNVAKVRLCRQVISAGVGDDARASSAINATLRQFPTIRSVVILDQRGNCLGDMSGDNRCLRG